MWRQTPTHLKSNRLGFLLSAWKEAERKKGIHFCSWDTSLKGNRRIIAQNSLPKTEHVLRSGWQPKGHFLPCPTAFTSQCWKQCSPWGPKPWSSPCSFTTNFRNPCYRIRAKRSRWDRTSIYDTRMNVFPCFWQMKHFVALFEWQNRERLAKLNCGKAAHRSLTRYFKRCNSINLNDADMEK